MTGVSLLLTLFAGASLTLVGFVHAASSGEPVDGGWSPWSNYNSSCSRECGNGTITNVRSCQNPVPQNGGAYCDTSNQTNTTEYPCNTNPCPGNETWGNWSDCSVHRCGIGNRTRHLLCGNEKCSGSVARSENETCNSYQPYKKNDCKDLCTRKENSKVCPDKAKCIDESNATHPRMRCICVMGYVMEKDNQCRLPHPPAPTSRPIPTLSPKEKVVVVVLTTTASTVLLILVGLTLIIFLLLRIFTPDRIIQMNMEIALEAAHLLLLIPLELANTDPIFCHVVSIGLQYFFTACFSFMLLEALHMYSLVAFVVQRNGMFSSLQNVLIGWSMPMFFLMFGLCFHYDDYGGEYHCWLQMDTNLLYAQIIPVIGLAVLTLILIESAGAASDYKALPNADEKQRFSAKMSQRSNLIIMPLVFASWILGMLSTYEQHLPLYSSFSILNTVVGVTIFVLHTLGNHEVRRKLKNLFCCRSGQKAKKR